MLTATQTEVLNNTWHEIQPIICSEIHRRNLHNDLDDILSDAITRLITAVAKHDIRDEQRIKSRARSCALDAIRTLVRVRKNVAEYRSHLSASATVARRNGAPLN